MNKQSNKKNKTIHKVANLSQVKSGTNKLEATKTTLIPKSLVNVNLTDKPTLKQIQTKNSLATFPSYALANVHSKDSDTRALANVNSINPNIILSQLVEAPKPSRTLANANSIDWDLFKKIELSKLLPPTPKTPQKNLTNVNSTNNQHIQKIQQAYKAQQASLKPVTVPLMPAIEQQPYVPGALANVNSIDNSFFIKNKKLHRKIKKPEPYAIQMLNITKTFNQGLFKANDNITLEVKKNEIHALVGENGAGKTTLMNVLFGLHHQDSGVIKVNGKEVHFKSPNDATKYGLGMVHQHFKLINVYTLLDNIILGAEKTKHGFLDRNTARKIITDLSKRYNLPVNLNTKVNSASVGEQQRTEILKLLYREADILIFDEPTAVLSDKEIEGFLLMLKEFKRLGKTIILITHKLNEVKAVADRATIIRRGQLIQTVNVATTSTQDIADLMVGHKLIERKNNVDDKNYKDRPVVCSIHNLKAYKLAQKHVLALNDFNLDIHAGEIVGLAGVEGNGQTELALILGGLLKNRVSGDITIYNCQTNQKFNVLTSSINQLYEMGLSHIPEDRHKYGLVLDETVAINAVLPQISQSPFSVLGFLNHHAINNYAKRIISQWDVRGANNGRALARSLSGGNQQKLVIGRELSRKHHFCVFVQPTRGLDLGAIQYVHQKIIEDAKKGAGILLISYELDEILSISSRVAVISRGQIVYNSLRTNTTREQIGNYIALGTSQNTSNKLQEHMNMVQLKAISKIEPLKGEQ